MPARMRKQERKEELVDRIKLLETMLLTRHFDEMVGRLYQEGRLAASTHLLVVLGTGITKSIQ